MRKSNLYLVIAFIVLFSCLSFVSAGIYTDVSDNHWAKHDIEFLTEKNLVQGMGNGKYMPNNDVTRAQFVTMVNKALEITEKLEVGNVEFTDVSKGSWYYEDVAKAVKLGYVSGNGDGTFMPNSPITREAAAAIIGRAFNLGESMEMASFTDMGEISDWALEFINRANEKGYIIGYPEGDFRPKSPITRSAAASIIYRIVTDVNTDTETETGTEIETGTNEIINIAMNYLGHDYIYGGNTPSGFDCSGFTQFVYGKVGIILPRVTVDQAKVGEYVDKDDLQPGDLLVFSNTYQNGVSHVGIYLGEGAFIHSSNPSVGVIISNINSGYWSNHFSYGRRMF